MAVGETYIGPKRLTGNIRYAGWWRFSVVLPVIFLLMQIFAGGCTKPAATLEKTEAVPGTVEPNQITTTASEPNKSGADKHDIISREPNEPQPTAPEAESAGPNTIAEPNVVKAADEEPKAEQITAVEPNEKKPGAEIDFNDKFAPFLARYVNADGMINYTSLRRHRVELFRVLNDFEQLERKDYDKWPKADKIALWINAYNLQMMRIIVENYPIEGSRWLTPFLGPDSIRHISGIWTDYKFTIMDEEFTISKLDKQVLRRSFDEPRAFFGLCHATMSSPPLKQQPYSGRTLDKQLDRQIRTYLASPRGFRIDREEKIVYLSAILESGWFGKEFISKYGTDKKFKDQEAPVRAVLNFICNYIDSSDVNFLQRQTYKVDFMTFNWTLNDSSRDL